MHTVYLSLGSNLGNRKRLLREAKVMVNSGTMYGRTAGEGFIRINIACPRARLMEALERIAATME